MTNSKELSNAVGTPCSSSFYPASIAYLIEERPLLWYEDPEEYDALLRAWLAELNPRGFIECILVKNLADHLWEFRRTKKLIQTAVSFFMPVAAGKILSPTSSGSFFGDYKDRDRVEALAVSVLYGTEAEDLKEGETTLAERMDQQRVNWEMIHFKAHEEAAERLQYLRRERDRVEDRIHRLLRDFEARRASMAAQARSLVDRETAQDVDAGEVN